MSKRKVTVVWFEVNQEGNPRVYFLRSGKGVPMAYTPSMTSSKRLNKLARRLSRNISEPFTCEVSSMPDILVGWSLIREERLYTPPQLGTQIAGQQLAGVPR